MGVSLNRRGFLRSVSLAGGMLAGSAILAACGGGAAAPAAEKPAAGPVTLDIGSKGDELLFDKAELKAPVGSKITVNLKNNSGANKHNWVLTRPGQGDAVATDGIAAGEGAGYVKANDNRVIALIGLIDPGKSGSVTFDAPAAGTYEYICTFPGHNVLMKGKLVIA